MNRPCLFTRTQRAAAFLAVIATQVATDARGQDVPGAADILQKIGIDQHIDAQVPLEATFRDETGSEVKLADYFGDGKPVILNLVYLECPMLCNMTMDGLIRTMRALPLSAGEDYTVLTVSFDAREGPKLAAGARDTALKRYDRKGADRGWHFLTGDEQNIRKLTDAVGFRFAWDDKMKQFAHAAALIVLTPQGRVSRYFFGVEYPPRDVEFGLIDSSQGNLGAPADRVLMLCYQYDPTTGKYGFAIISALRVAGGVTLAALVGGIVWMVRRDRGDHDDRSPPDGSSLSNLT